MNFTKAKLERDTWDGGWVTTLFKAPLSCQILQHSFLVFRSDILQRTSNYTFHHTFATNLTHLVIITKALTNRGATPGRLAEVQLAWLASLVWLGYKSLTYWNQSNQQLWHIFGIDINISLLVDKTQIWTKLPYLLSIEKPSYYAPYASMQ